MNRFDNSVTKVETSSPTNSKEGRNILLLGFVSLLNDISSEIIQPVLPLFITSLGGGSLAVGLIGGVSDGLPSIISVFSGYWSDWLGKRKPLVVAGYGLSALAKAVLPISMIWQQVFVIRMVERSGKGLRSAPRDAMISESAIKERRGRGFGLHRTMDTLGAVIGSLLAYALWRNGLDFRMIFVIAGAIALIALIPFIYIREGIYLPKTRASLNLSKPSPELKNFLFIASLFSLGNFSYMFFILRAQELFIGLSSIGGPLLLYAFFNIVYAIFSLPVGIWSDRIGRKNVLSLGYAFYAITAVGFAVVSSVAWLVVLFGLYGLVFAIVDASQRAFVSDLSRATVRSTSLGIYFGAIGMVAIFSGLIAGELWLKFGPTITFLFGAFLAALAAIVLQRMKNVREIL
ncbi:MAG: MFS transporter [Methanotrichaceae archaeon]|nr:MFS transporter [Methanotrichaceae archaeon]